MAPSAVPLTPPEELSISDLPAAAVAQKISHFGLQPLDASKLKFTRTSTPMTVPEQDDPVIAASTQCTDHMLTAVWKSSTGWDAPELRPYGNLSLAPTASVLQ